MFFNFLGFTATLRPKKFGGSLTWQKDYLRHPNQKNPNKRQPNQYLAAPLAPSLAPRLKITDIGSLFFCWFEFVIYQNSNSHEERKRPVLQNFLTYNVLIHVHVLALQYPPVENTAPNHFTTPRKKFKLAVVVVLKKWFVKTSLRCYLTLQYVNLLGLWVNFTNSFVQRTNELTHNI